jgi:hypothetical protein
MLKDAPDHLARRTALVTVALVAALVFGITVLAREDWIPGVVIVAASLVGLARVIPVIRRPRGRGPTPAPPTR